MGCFSITDMGDVSLVLGNGAYSCPHERGGCYYPEKLREVHPEVVRDGELQPCICTPYGKGAFAGPAGEKAVLKEDKLNGACR